MSSSPSEQRRLPTGPHGIPADVVARNQRERLVAAVAEACAERGYAAGSVADVARRAGVSTVTFYRLFDDRQSCMLAAHRVDHVLLFELRGSGLLPALLEEHPPEARGAIGLMIERSIANCAAMSRALVELGARVLVDPRHPRPLAPDRPMRLLSNNHRFDTAAGRIDLREPRFVLDCPPYEELRAAAARLRDRKTRSSSASFPDPEPAPRAVRATE